MSNDVLTKEQYEELLRLGAENQSLEAAIAQQQAQADALRVDEVAPMRGNGRVQVAPNALEVIGNMGRNIMSSRMGQEAGQQRQQQIGNTNSQNQTVMRSILGLGGQGAAPAGAPAPVVNPYQGLKFPGGAA